MQTIQGSNIGLTIPAGEVGTMLEGSLGKPTIAVTPAVNGGAPKYEIVVPVIDPLKKLQSASVHYVLKSVPADPSKAGGPQLASEAASRKVDLPLQGGVARVELPLDAKATPPVKQVTVQASYVTGAGKTVYLDPQVIAVPAPVQVTTTTRRPGQDHDHDHPGGRRRREDDAPPDDHHARRFARRRRAPRRRGPSRSATR